MVITVAVLAILLLTSLSVGTDLAMMDPKYLKLSMDYKLHPLITIFGGVSALCAMTCLI